MAARGPWDGLEQLSGRLEEGGDYWCGGSIKDTCAVPRFVVKMVQVQQTRNPGIRAGNCTVARPADHLHCRGTACTMPRWR
jgi:hypothetical protein